MERRDFIKTCGYTSIGVALSMQSCASAYYAPAVRKENILQVAISEFSYIKGDEFINRDFVFVKTPNIKYPICIHKTRDDEYLASLMMCTHNQCELNAGGGIYTCPCHGSEFSVRGEVLEGPADRDLNMFKTELVGDNLLIHVV